MNAVSSTHLDRRAGEFCATCGKSLHSESRIEAATGEVAFCSRRCLEANEETEATVLIGAMQRPIRTGWRLWIGQARQLTFKVALPLGGILWFVDYVTWMTNTAGPVTGFVLFAIMAAVGASVVSITLSHAYLGRPVANPWIPALARFIPWVTTWACFLVASLVGTILFVIPGIIAGIRLFWADEYALMHRHGPLAALRESIRLTSGIGGRVFLFQFVMGFVQFASIMLLIFLPLGLVMLISQNLPPSILIGLFHDLIFMVLLVHFYASIHAPEIVYFYGLRAIRNTLPPGDTQGDWVAPVLKAQPRLSVFVVVVLAIVVYTQVAWVLLQVAEITFDLLGLPGWALTLVVAVAIAGLPAVIFLAWFLARRWVRRRQVDEKVAAVQPRS